MTEFLYVWKRNIPFSSIFDKLLDIVGRNSSILMHRGSYTRTRVLLNLLNELGKRDKIRG